MSPWPWASCVNRTNRTCLVRRPLGWHNGATRFRGGLMTNTLAIALGTLIVGAIAFDAVINGGETLVFLAKKLAELIEWLAFWR